MYSCSGKIDTFSVPSKSRKCVNLSGKKVIIKNGQHLIKNDQKWSKWSKMATYLRNGSHYKTKKYVYERGTRDWIAQKFNYKTKISVIKHIFAQIVFRSIMNLRKVKKCFAWDHFCNFCEIGAISWADICSFWTPLSISKNVWHPDSRFQFNGTIASYRLTF